MQFVMTGQGDVFLFPEDSIDVFSIAWGYPMAAQGRISVRNGVPDYIAMGNEYEIPVEGFSQFIEFLRNQNVDLDSTRIITTR